ncbi:MAG TPA: MarR family transcriptional regulator, partial [Chthonomonadales bacterium]|nr:MarR family transcriptional regulator [Chthonomonadales bacterium]
HDSSASTCVAGVEEPMEEITPVTLPSGKTLLRDLAARRRAIRIAADEDCATVDAVEGFGHLLRTYVAFYDLLSERLAEYDLSLSRLGLLMILKSSPGQRLAMTRICERMCVTKTNITRLVDGLEKEGLVVRSSKPQDRRVVLAELTDQGDMLLQSVLPGHLHELRRLWNGLDEEETQALVDLLIRLRQGAICANEATYGNTPHGSAHAVEHPECVSESQDISGGGFAPGLGKVP